jgi:hypothetical protein
MKHFINILVILILVFFAIGITYLQARQMTAAWHLLYVPIMFFMLGWGIKLNQDYKND